MGTVDRDDLEPWDRQPAESEVAFQAWAHYRDMPGRRSAHKVAARVGKNPAVVSRWSARWGWVERARLYDNHVDAEVRRANEKRIADFRVRAARQAQGKAQTLMLVDAGLAERLGKLQQDGQGLSDLIASIDIGDLLSLATKGAQALPQLLRAEALALGDTTERLAATVDAQVATGARTDDDAMTKRIREDEHLRSLAATLIEMAGASTA